MSTKVQKQMIESLSQNRTINIFTGDASQTNFDLTKNILSHKESISVFISGVLQTPSAYSILQSGTTSTLVFSSAPAAQTSNIEVHIADVVPMTTIATQSIASDMIKPNAITSNKIANSSCVTSKINDLAITNAKLAQNCVDSTKITDLAITNSAIANSQIGIEKLSTSTISSLHDGGKNYISNPDFSIWQRGVTLDLTADDNVFLADRWKVTAGDGAGTASREEHSENLDGSKYYLKLEQTSSPSSNLAKISQMISGLEFWDSKTITLSFWAKSNITLGIVPSLQRRYGEFNENFITLASQTLTTSWTRYSITHTMPSLFSSIAAGSLDLMNIEFAINSLNNFEVNISNVQLEMGSVASKFIAPTIEENLKDCEYYYKKSYNIDVLPQATTTIGAEILDWGKPDASQMTNSFFIKSMYKKPSVKIYGTDSSGTENRLDVYDNSSTVSGFVNLASSNKSDIFLGANGGYYRIENAPNSNISGQTSTQNFQLIFHYVAEAEMVFA